MEQRSRRDRSDRSGRVALLGCGGGVLLLLGITALGVFGYAAGVIAVHMLPGYQAAVDAIETREVEDPNPCERQLRRHAGMVGRRRPASTCDPA